MGIGVQACRQAGGHFSQQQAGGRAGSSTHFSRSVFVTASSSRRAAVGHSAVTTASRAYTCSFFFRICSYTAPRDWCLALWMQGQGGREMW